jgi:acetyl esterase/lipase
MAESGPMLVRVGGNEVLRDPLDAFADEAEPWGVEVERVVGPHVFHDRSVVRANGASSMLTVERIADLVDRPLARGPAGRDRAPFRLDPLI